MPNWLFPSGTALQSLGLALMVGGLLALGAFTAPVLFKQFPRPEAGEAMTVIFRRFDTVLLASVVMLALGELLRVLATGRMFFLPGVPGWLSGFRAGMLMMLVGLTLISTLALHPQLERGQVSGSANDPGFGKVHQQSEKFAKLELLVAAVLLVLNVVL